MVQVEIVMAKISDAKRRNEGGGVKGYYVDYVNTDLNNRLNALEKYNDIIDVKSSHFTAHRHNNGGCDEVWVQYDIIYKSKADRPEIILSKECDN